jgi:hypothetical protein
MKRPVEEWRGVGRGRRPRTTTIPPRCLVMFDAERRSALDFEEVVEAAAREVQELTPLVRLGLRGAARADVGAPRKEVAADECLNDAGLAAALAPNGVVEDMLLAEDGFRVMLRSSDLERGDAVGEGLSVEEWLLVEDGIVVEVVVEGLLVGDGAEARGGEVAELNDVERHLVFRLTNSNTETATWSGIGSAC